MNRGGFGFEWRPRHPAWPGRLLALLATASILKVVVITAWSYRSYVPPDFTSDFLRGRERLFSGPYRWAFYTHIVSGPVSLILGLVLVGERARSRFPTWHRPLGRIQVACVLGLVTPSGLAMAYHAAAGPVAAGGLATLAVVTAASAWLGARAAAGRRFADHRRWMWRCYLALCSAVVLRVIGGLATTLEVAAPWVDPLAAWLSWLAPLAIFEMIEARKSRALR